MRRQHTGGVLMLADKLVVGQQLNQPLDKVDHLEREKGRHVKGTDDGILRETQRK